MTHEELRKIKNIINKEWEQDSKIDSLKIDDELLKIPILIAKYAKYRAEVQFCYSKLDHDYRKMKGLRYFWWKGMSSKEDLEKYNWEQNQRRFKTHNELMICIETDENVIEIQEKRDMASGIIKTLETILKELSNRTYQINEYMKWQKTISGS